MLYLGQAARLLVIQRVLLKHGLDDLVFALRLFRPLRWVRLLLPWNWFGRPGGNAPRGARLRAALAELGPIYVKLGQLLSTRRDLLPDDIAAELAGLQDQVPPFSGAVARQTIEQALGKPIEEAFAEFDETPLASASIAQVHAAALKDGRAMIVKVVRPGIRKATRRDLAIIHALADTLEKYSTGARRLGATAVAGEFEKMLFDELDLMREAACAAQLRRNFEGSEVLHIPAVEWELTSRNVMVMERVEGVSIGDVPALEKAGVDLKWLAERGVELFFTQVFRDRFFHADLHPGNIFVTPGQDGRARIAMVDFGIMSSLSEFDQRYLAENFLAFLHRDYQQVAKLHIESGWVPPETRVDEFEFAIRTVCEPLFDRPLREISIGALLLRLFQTARRFNMVILPQLLLLQKTLVSVEGIGRQLYPELDLWRTARPVMDRWMNSRFGARGLLREARDSVPYWLNRLPQLPGQALDLVERLKEGKIQVELKSGGLDELGAELRKNHRHTMQLIIGCSLALAGVIWHFSGGGGELPGGISLPALLLGVGGGALILKTLTER